MSTFAFLVLCFQACLLQTTSSVAGAAATSAKQAKRRKYGNLEGSFIFAPFGVETLGPWGPGAQGLFEKISKKIIESTGDPRAGNYLGQRISLAIQRGNAAIILGTKPRCGNIDENVYGQCLRGYLGNGYLGGFGGSYLGNYADGYLGGFGNGYLGGYFGDRADGYFGYGNGYLGGYTGNFWGNCAGGYLGGYANGLLGGYTAPFAYGAYDAYGGEGVGDVVVNGQMPVEGVTLVDGQVPITGAVEFGGIVSAAGTVTISGTCGCGCRGGYLY